MLVHGMGRVKRPCPAWLPLAGLSWLTLACGGGGDDVSSAPQAYARPAYTRLSETGLYADFGARSLASGVEAFEPAFPLWSDAADKQRWLRLPPGTSIDAADMNRWVFPIGTRVWKQFSLDGVTLETRLIERYGSGREDYWMGAFVWDESGSDATYVEAGQADVLGTAHDAPSEDQCWSCHNGENGRLLGVSALQLGRDPAETSGLSLTRLTQQALIAPGLEPGARRYLPPGGELASAALGYLHANCGHCHNSRGTAWPDTQMVLRLNVTELADAAGAGPPAEDTELYRSLIGQAVQYFRDEDFPLRVVAQHPEESAVIGRMSVRGPRAQMPPLGTESVDAAGLDLVTRWIASLP